LWRYGWHCRPQKSDFGRPRAPQTNSRRSTSGLVEELEELTYRLAVITTVSVSYDSRALARPWHHPTLTLSANADTAPGVRPTSPSEQRWADAVRQPSYGSDDDGHGIALQVDAQREGEPMPALRDRQFACYVIAKDASKQQGTGGHAPTPVVIRDRTSSFGNARSGANEVSSILSQQAFCKTPLMARSELKYDSRDTLLRC
jgi:hypothetical protein